MRRRVLDNEQLEKPRSWGGIESPRKMGGKLPCAPPSGCGNTEREFGCLECASGIEH